MERMELVKRKYNDIISLAESLYSIDLRHVVLATTLKGRSLGRASRIGNDMKVNLNINAINGDDVQFSALLDNTIAHEVAHIITYINPTLGRAHNRGWQRICLALGGNGESHYDSSEVGNVSSYKVGAKYVYDVEGELVQIGKIRHKRLQTGKQTYNCVTRSGKHQIKPHMFTGRTV